jgi:AMIN domain
MFVGTYFDGLRTALGRRNIPETVYPDNSDTTKVLLSFRFFHTHTMAREIKDVFVTYHHSLKGILAALGLALVLPLVAPSSGHAFNWPWQNQGFGGNNQFQQSPQVLNVTYVPAEMRLAIRVDRPNDVSIYSPVRQPHSYQFYINNAHIVGNSTTIPIQGGDPFVRQIRLEQRSISNLPAVLVTMDLLQSASNMQFDIQRISIDGSVSVAMRPAGVPDSIAMFAVPTTAATNPVYTTGPSVAMTPMQTMTVPVQPYRPAWTPPPQPIQNMGSAAGYAMAPQLPQMAYQPATPYPINQSSPAAPATIAWPTVKDIVSQSNRDIIIASGDNPFTVERAFSLAGPDRYVLDLTPAKLGASLRNRVLEDDPASKVTVKTSQLDDDTVRVVLNYKKEVVPIQMTQENQNKTIHLRF